MKYILFAIILFHCGACSSSEVEHSESESLQVLLPMAFDAAAEGELDVALSHFHEALNAFPGAWEPYEALGGFYYCIGENKAALLNYTIAKQRAGQNDALKSLLSRIVDELSKPEPEKPTLNRIVDCSRVRGAGSR